MRRKTRYRLPLGPMTARDVDRLRARMMNELGTPLSPSDILDDAPPDAMSRIRPHPPEEDAPRDMDDSDDLF